MGAAEFGVGEVVVDVGGLYVNFGRFGVDVGAGDVVLGHPDMDLGTLCQVISTNYESVTNIRMVV